MDRAIFILHSDLLQVCQWMTDSGGTGACEESSDSEADTVLVPIEVRVLPFVVGAVAPPPFGLPVPIHTIVVNTGSTSVTIRVAGFTTASPDLLLVIAEELIRSARDRLRSGTLLPFNSPN